jgi:serine/threonine-protein kinase
MGIVYQAVSEADGNLVALKTVSPAVQPTDRDLQCFMREATILRQLQNPNIVAFREMNAFDGRLYFAMDFVPGTDAARLLQAHGPLPVTRAVGLICQLLDALAYAHGRGFVHRDIKPANVLLTEKDGRETVRLADFGLARVYQASPLSGLTLAGNVAGTPQFMPPEQVLHYRTVQPAADQYAAAATLYNLLTGCFLYDTKGDVQDMLKQILLNDPVPIHSRRPELPARLAVIIHRALARKPAERFADVQALRKALESFGPRS